MRSTQPAARRIERRVAGLASGAAKSACSVSPPAGNPSFALGIYLVTRTGWPRREREKLVPGSRPVPAIARRTS